MRECLSTPEFPKYILLFAQSLSSIPNSPYVLPPCRSVCLSYPCCSVCHPPASHCWTEWCWWWETYCPPKRPPSASRCSLSWHLSMPLRLCSSTFYSQIDSVYIYMETWILYATLWCSEAWNYTSDKYDRWNGLWLWTSKNQCFRNTAQCFPQSCTAFSTACEPSHRPGQTSAPLQNVTIL